MCDVTFFKMPKVLTFIIQHIASVLLIFYVRCISGLLPDGRGNDSVNHDAGSFCTALSCSWLLDHRCTLLLIAKSPMVTVVCLKHIVISCFWCLLPGLCLFSTFAFPFIYVSVYLSACLYFSPSQWETRVEEGQKNFESISKTIQEEVSQYEVRVDPHLWQLQSLVSLLSLGQVMLIVTLLISDMRCAVQLL